MAFKPFPVGTIRGPYRCGIGHESARGKSHGADSGVQFMVQTRGGWVPFIGHLTEEAAVQKRAEEYRDKMLATLPPIAYVDEETIIRLMTK